MFSKAEKEQEEEQWWLSEKMIYAISTGQGVEGNAKEEERGSLNLYSSQGDEFSYGKLSLKYI